MAAEQLRRELLDLARARRRKPADGLRWTPTCRIRPRTALADLDLWAALQEAVVRLPTEPREVFSLVFYHGWEQTQIAELLQVSTRQVRRQWNEARRTLDQGRGRPATEVIVLRITPTPSRNVRAGIISIGMTDLLPGETLPCAIDSGLFSRAFAAFLIVGPSVLADSPRQIGRSTASGSSAATADRGWKTVTVPSAMQSHEGTDWHGVGWYRKAVDKVDAAGPESGSSSTSPRRPRSRRSTGTAPRSANTSAAGRRSAFDVTDLVRKAGPDATHELTVKLDERVGHNTQGFLPIVQPHFGGIWQSVQLLTLPENVVDDMRVEVPKGRRIAGLVAEGTETQGRGRRDAKRGQRHGPDREANDRGEGQPTPAQRPTADRPRRAELGLLPAAARAEPAATTCGAADLKRDQGPRLQPDEVLPVGAAEAATRPRRRGRHAHLDRVPDLAPASSTPKHRADLMREFAEFFAHDRNHPSVILRSLTCETGPSRRHQRIRRPCTTKCKEMIPGASSRTTAAGSSGTASTTSTTTTPTATTTPG